MYRILISFVSLVSIISAANGRRYPRLADFATPAIITEFPFHVSIQMDGAHKCGGSLISKTHVLTAAHCVREKIAMPLHPLNNVAKLVVEVGSNIIGRGKTYNIRRLSYHKYYSMALTGPYLANDIAVITLQTPVEESDEVRIIGLPDASFLATENMRFDLCGYGGNRADQSPFPYLRKTEVYYYPYNECNEFYIRERHQTIQRDIHICATGGRGFGTCAGDSGGGLIYNGKVVGVVSGGNGKCGTGEPDVFSNVANFLDYIKYEMEYDFNTADDANSPAMALNFDENGSADEALAQVFPPPYEQLILYPVLPEPVYLVPASPIIFY